MSTLRIHVELGPHLTLWHIQAMRKQLRDVVLTGVEGQAASEIKIRGRVWVGGEDAHTHAHAQAL